MIKQFTIGFSRTINLGNFESARVEASVVLEVEPDHNLELLKDAAQMQLRDLLERTWRAQYKPRDKETVIQQGARS